MARCSSNEGLFHRLRQRRGHHLPVPVIPEDFLTPVATAHDVIRRSWKFDADLSGHGGQTASGRRLVNNLLLTPFMHNLLLTPFMTPFMTPFILTPFILTPFILTPFTWPWLCR